EREGVGVKVAGRILRMDQRRQTKQEKRQAAELKPHAVCAATTGLRLWRNCHATMAVMNETPAQIRYGTEGCTSSSDAAKMGPKMRARLPALWAVPMVAPCSSAGVRLESMPKTGGRVRLEPIERMASTTNRSGQLVMN